ncbi:MAG: hypothetical protein WEC37_01130 [Anaerolineales bacterium]
MTAKLQKGIYLIISFNWPSNFTKEMAQNAKKLHEAVLAASWIRETLAASGGIGSGASSLWAFWMEDYASLDRLLHNENDPVCQAYLAFFPSMVDVTENIREQVVFL